jgi:phosphoribosylanthranilate isomerase
MKHPANSVEVAALSPDFMGFIFFAKSPRFVGDDFVMPSIPSSVRKVGVFVNESSERILFLSKKYSFDFVQLHGDEPIAPLAELKSNGLKIVKAFRVDIDFNFETTVPYQKYADYFLFDTKGKHYGGNNETFNWGLLKNYNQQIPFLLSGGLNRNNLSSLSVTEGMNCVGYDFNSGVEIEPGFKDIDKVKQVIKFLRTENLTSQI